MKKAYIPILALTALTASAATPLKVEDYTDIKLVAPASIKEMRPLADGKSYASISNDGKQIVTYSYATGKQTGVLFDIDGVKGDCRIKSFAGYKVSANGKKILLWTDVEKIYRHSFRAQYYVYDIARSTLKEVSGKGAQQGAVISHDGRMVAYMRDNNIFISNLDYGTDNAITTDGERNKVIYGTSDWCYEEEFGVVNTMRWSYDDQVLAFMRFDETDVPAYSFDIYSGYCDPIEEYDYYPGAYTYKYPLAGYNNSVVSVQAYDINTRVIKTMDLPIGATDYVPSLEFRPGKENVLMAMIVNRDQNKLQMYSVNPGSTVSRLIYTDTSTAWLSPSAYQMVTYYDNSFIIASERTGWRHLYKYDYSGTLQSTITKGDYNVTDYYGFDAKSGTYYLQCTKLGAVNRNIAAADSKGALRLLNPQEGTERGNFSGDFSYYVRTYSNIATPPQYTLCNTKGGKVADLELNEEYAARYASIPVKELLKVKNAVGEEMDAYIIKPRDFDASRQYPLLMHQYNGPDSQDVVNAWKLDGLFWLAQEGYIVATVDGRGTGNRSREWANAVYMQLGKYETEDQIAGARYFMSLPYIDASRTACFGWSYGGYMTLMELSASDCPFKAGIAMAPVTDWRFYDSIYTERYMRTPGANEAGYNEASALNHTHGMNSRLLIMSGTADDNVHFYNTLKYTSKLTAEDKLFDMMAYTGFEHSLPMCNARTMLYRKIKDFLDIRVKTSVEK